MFTRGEDFDDFGEISAILVEDKNFVFSVSSRLFEKSLTFGKCVGFLEERGALQLESGWAFSLRHRHGFLPVPNQLNVSRRVQI